MEDLQAANRLSNLLHLYESTDKRISDANLGFGTRKTLAVAASVATPQLHVSEEHKTIVIPQGGSKRVCFRINCSPIMNQFKWLPLAFLNGGITIKLTLDDPNDVVWRKQNGDGTAQSVDYRLEDVAFHASLCTLQSELMEKFYQSVAAGESLILHTQSWSHNQLFLAPGDDGSCSASLNRPLTRIDTLIATFAPEVTDAMRDKGLSYPTFFYGGEGHFAEESQFQFSIGATKYPQVPIRGYAQVYYRNMEALGITHSSAHSLGVDYDKSFKNNHFACMVDTAKVPGVKSTGESSQNGQEIRLQVDKFSEPGTAAKRPRRLYVAALYDTIYEIRQGSVVKMD